jgi:hypothetical protein
MSNGVIIYRGPSVLDGSPIICIATGLSGRASRNEKTGGLIQTWIIRDDMSPVEAVKTGADASICGACPHRGTVEAGKVTGRSCYVTVFQAPLSVYKSHLRGIYEQVEASELPGLFAGRKVRVGSYGDPAAVPLAIWDAVMQQVEARTGYTHQWRTCDKGLAAYVMASCDTEQDHVEAKAAGWRTFRIRSSVEAATFKREVVCPASAEAGYKTNCATCVACGGHSAKAKADIVIVAHGSKAITNAYHARHAA